MARARWQSVARTQGIGREWFSYIHPASIVKWGLDMNAMTDHRQHTATPWRTDKSNLPYRIYADALPAAVPYWPFDPFVADASNVENAEFIVRACNSYQTMLNVLHDVKDIVKAEGTKTQFQELCEAIEAAGGKP